MAWRESTWRDEGREWAWGTLCQGERRASRSETLLTAEEWVRLGWWPLMKYGSRRGGAHADRPTDGWENTYAHMIGESGGCRGGRKKALWWTRRAMRSGVVNSRTLPESTGSTSSLRSQANSHLVSLGLCPIHVTHLLMQMREEREMIGLSHWFLYTHWQKHENYCYQSSLTSASSDGGKVFSTFIYFIFLHILPLIREGFFQGLRWAKVSQLYLLFMVGRHTFNLHMYRI